jgi:hypothetical protein
MLPTAAAQRCLRVLLTVHTIIYPDKTSQCRSLAPITCVNQSHAHRTRIEAAKVQVQAAIDEGQAKWK